MLAPQSQNVFYPETDGKPMAETDFHRQLIIKMTDILQGAFPEAYVSGNICLYYEAGNPKKMISPDTLLCSSQRPTVKRTYFAWEENAQLDLVMEFSSFSTRREDHHKKKRIYEQILQVPYYVIFDPYGIYLNVWHLQDRQYIPLEPDEQGYYDLMELNLYLAIENNNSLRFFDSARKPLLTAGESGRQQAEQERFQKEEALKREEEERQQKEEALAEIERLRALLKNSSS